MCRITNFRGLYTTYTYNFLGIESAITQYGGSARSVGMMDDACVPRVMRNPSVCSAIVIVAGSQPASLLSCNNFDNSCTLYNDTRLLPTTRNTTNLCTCSRVYCGTGIFRHSTNSHPVPDPIRRNDAPWKFTAGGQLYILNVKQFRTVNREI